MIQAATDGVVDFSRARLLDRQWWRQLDILLAALNVRNQRQRLELRFNYHLGMLQVPRIQDEYWKECQDKVIDLYQDLVETYSGEKTKTKTGRRQEMARGMTAAWKERFGDPNDPVVAARIEKVAEGLKNRRAQGRVNNAKSIRPVRRLH